MLRRCTLAVVALAACRAAPSSPPTPPPSISVSGIADASTVAEPEPIVLAPPSDVACTFAPKGLPVALALDGESPWFAFLSSASGTLAVATGPATHGAFLEHAGEGLHMRGWVQAEGLELRAMRPVLFDQWLVPRSSTVLRWTSAKRGSLELRLDERLLRDARLTTLAFREETRGIAACGDVVIHRDPDDYDAKTVLLRGRKGTEQHLRTAVPIPVAREPGGAPVADLQYTYADTAVVLVVERRAGHALVVVESWDPATLYGWIPDSFFVPSPGQLVGGQHTRSPTLRHRVYLEKDRRHVACERPVRIVAEAAAGRRAYVGEIDAGTPFVFVVEERRDAFREIEVEGMYASEGARLLADRAALDACRSVTPRR